MKNLIGIGLLAAMLSMPVYAHAQEGAMPQKEMPAMNCPMMGDMMSVHKDMGGMMEEMHSMMEDMTDPAMKERMQAMHDRMASMMAHMQDMHGMMGKGMMGRGMMGGSMMQDDGGAETDDTPETSEDHESHH